MAKRTMQEATFLILTALASSRQHGYGIITDVSNISDGRVQLRAGTLYTALDRLRDDGVIEATGRRSSIAGCDGTTGLRRPAKRSWRPRRTGCERTRTPHLCGSIPL